MNEKEGEIEGKGGGERKTEKKRKQIRGERDEQGDTSQEKGRERQINKTGITNKWHSNKLERIK